MESSSRHPRALPRILADRGELDRILVLGAERRARVAAPKIALVKERIGFMLPPAMSAGHDPTPLKCGTRVRKHRRSDLSRGTAMNDNARFGQVLPALRPRLPDRAESRTGDRFRHLMARRVA